MEKQGSSDPNGEVYTVCARAGAIFRRTDSKILRSRALSFSRVKFNGYTHTLLHNRLSARLQHTLSSLAAQRHAATAWRFMLGRLAELLLRAQCVWKALLEASVGASGVPLLWCSEGEAAVEDI